VAETEISFSLKGVERILIFTQKRIDKSIIYNYLYGFSLTAELPFPDNNPRTSNGLLQLTMSGKEIKARSLRKLARRKIFTKTAIS
jgi:hypothetical protein